MRTNISSNTKWEPVFGYSRAVKINGHIYVSGTTATDESGNVVGKNDMYEQSKQTILNIETALKKAGAELTDVVRTRVYVTDIDLWKEVSRAHSEFFGEVMPATSMVEISKLIHPDMLVEIEAVAVLSE